MRIMMEDKEKRHAVFSSQLRAWYETTCTAGINKRRSSRSPLVTLLDKRFEKQCSMGQTVFMNPRSSSCSAALSLGWMGVLGWSSQD